MSSEVPIGPAQSAASIAQLSETLLTALAQPSSLTAQLLVESQAEFRRAIEAALIIDRSRLSRLLDELLSSARRNQASPVEQGGHRILRFARQLSRSLGVVEQRCQVFEGIGYPSELPVTQVKEKIVAALQQHQVVIVAGETGSGKTTQIPKICADMGRGIFGQVGHTQPRRIAARTVAGRIAEELGVELGGGVGYQFRFNDRSDAATRIKVMTDGILLAEIAADRSLRAYDTLIIDEAHERSLNIDFLLGYLKTLLPRRPDLKLILTSATIDVERFANFFDAAPVVTVEGRSFPVDIRYLDAESESQDSAAEARTEKARADKAQVTVEEGDLAGRVQMALDVLEAEHGHAGSGPRDVLVFLPGEREIRDVSQMLRKQNTPYEILPLYARLSQKEQQRVFAVGDSGGQAGQRSSFKRRVVLATNVAETSITVPGIGYVIDVGLARISRYSARSKLQRLPIEAISKASARQRAGRCGRLAPGVCYRLYSEQDFNGRSDFTEPEILRTSLAAVILQMKRLNLGEIRQFPFIQPPEERQVRSGIKVLSELGAISETGELTATGRQLASLPVDPALGRMLLAAIKKRCLAEVLVIVSAMAVQDPREFPQDKRQQAESQHQRFWDARSDFLMWLNLWSYFEALRDSLSQNQLRKRCKKEFLSFMRMREWRDLHRQLTLAVRPLLAKSGRKTEETCNGQRDYSLIYQCDDQSGNEQKDSLHQAATGSLASCFSDPLYENIHRALLSGIPLQVGRKHVEDKRGQDKRKSAGKNNSRIHYRSVRNLQFHLFPGSAQFKKIPTWVLAGEIVETQKVYARSAAWIDPKWIVRELPHLVKFQYSEPYWHVRRGQVLARSNASLYGLDLGVQQTVDYEKVDVRLAREVFIRQALVEQQLNPEPRLLRKAAFWRNNCELIEKTKALEEKLRRRDLLVDEMTLFAFYDKGLPEHIVGRASLWRWLNNKSVSQQRLCLQQHDVLRKDSALNEVEQFPEQLHYGDLSFPLSYRFMPGADDDGVTAEIPLSVMPSLPVYLFDWLVPGMLHDKCVDLIKSLPKNQRKRLVPVPSVASQLLAKIDVAGCMQQNIPLTQALAEKIRVHYEVSIDAGIWRAESEKLLDNYCRMRFKIVDDAGEVLRSGRALPVLQRELIVEIDAQVASASQAGFSRQHITHWDFGSVLQSTQSTGGSAVTGYPALKDAGDSVSIELVVSQEIADAKSRDGILRLAMLASGDRTRYLRKQLRRVAVPVLPYINVGSHDELIDDLIMAAIAHSCFDEFKAGIPRSEQAFSGMLESGSATIVTTANELEQLLHDILQKYQRCCEQVQQKRRNFALQCDDIEQQLSALIFQGFLRQSGLEQLRHIPRYLQAILVRFDRMGAALARDGEYCEKLSSLYKPLRSLLYNYPLAMLFDRQVIQYRWMLEELRVSLFAQQLKTPVSVSFQRVSKAWNTINLNQYPLLD